MWPDLHLTPALVDELRQRLDRYAIDAKMLMGNREAAIAFAGAVNAYQRQALGEMLKERLEQLRLALGTAQDFQLESGALQVSPLVVSLLTLPAEVQLLRDALAHP
jgi:hypothetical protein